MPAKTDQPTRDNSLSIVLFVLFAICIAGQRFAGWRLLNETLAARWQASIDFWYFLSSGTCWEGLLSNWQAAVLQLGSLIAFSTFLYERGAPHSLDPHKAKRKQERRKDGRFAWGYRHSLLLTFLLLFILAFVGIAFPLRPEPRPDRPDDRELPLRLALESHASVSLSVTGLSRAGFQGGWLEQ